MATKISKSHKSVKHEIIDKDNTRTVAAVALATFVVVFCVFATKALFSQSLYHGRIISEKEKALVQLEENKQELETLEKSYLEFVNEPANILGGDSTGSGALDGNNADLVLNALPRVYDYVALSSSFEKILKDGGYTIESIGGSENGGFEDSFAEEGSASSQGLTTSASATEIPYTLSFTATKDRTADFLKTLESSIRPMYVDSIQVEAGEKTLLTSILLRTYYSEEKTFSLGSKEVE